MEHWVPLPAPGPPRTKVTVTLLLSKAGADIVIE